MLFSTVLLKAVFTWDCPPSKLNCRCTLHFTVVLHTPFSEYRIFTTTRMQRQLAKYNHWLHCQLFLHMSVQTFLSRNVLIIFFCLSSNNTRLLVLAKLKTFFDTIASKYPLLCIPFHQPLQLNLSQLSMPQKRLLIDMSRIRCDAEATFNFATAISLTIFVQNQKWVSVQAVKAK